LVLLHVVQSAKHTVDLGSVAFFFSGSSSSNQLLGGENSIYPFASTQLMYGLPLLLTSSVYFIFPFLSFGTLPLGRVSTTNDIAANGGQSNVSSKSYLSFSFSSSRTVDWFSNSCCFCF
jgi:hypothetical protein